MLWTQRGMALKIRMVIQGISWFSFDITGFINSVWRLTVGGHSQFEDVLEPLTLISFFFHMVLFQKPHCTFQEELRSWSMLILTHVVSFIKLLKMYLKKQNKMLYGWCFKTSSYHLTNKCKCPLKFVIVPAAVWICLLIWKWLYCKSPLQLTLFFCELWKSENWALTISTCFK